MNEGWGKVPEGVALHRTPTKSYHVPGSTGPCRSLSFCRVFLVLAAGKRVRLMQLGSSGPVSRFRFSLNFGPLGILQEFVVAFSVVQVTDGRILLAFLALPSQTSREDFDARHAAL